MKHLLYTHSINSTLTGKMTGAVMRMLEGSPDVPEPLGSPRHTHRVLLRSILILVAVIVQAAVLVAVSELVELVQDTMQLYLDLARMHLDLTAVYVAATTPQ